MGYMCVCLLFCLFIFLCINLFCYIDIRGIFSDSIFLVPASASRLVQQSPWYVLSCLWDGAYKRTLAVNR